jgi:hypothetical protein
MIGLVLTDFAPGWSEITIANPGRESANVG